MKRLLLFLLSMVFLSILNSCQEPQLITGGKLSKISETSATIDDISYTVENGTTDFFFKDKIEADGKNAFIYRSDGKLHVSKLNQKNISDFTGLKGGWCFIIFCQALLSLIISIVLLCCSVQKLLYEDRAICKIFCIIIFLPILGLILSKTYPKTCRDLATRYDTNLVDYGTLTDISNKNKTINERKWFSSKNNPQNAPQEPLQIGTNYAVLRINGEINFYKSDDIIAIKKEIAYTKLYTKLLFGEYLIIILSLYGIVLLFFLNHKIRWEKIKSLFHTKKKKMKGELNDDDRQGHGHWD